MRNIALYTTLLLAGTFLASCSPKLVPRSIVETTTDSIRTTVFKKDTTITIAAKQIETQTAIDTSTLSQIEKAILDSIVTKPTETTVGKYRFKTKIDHGKVETVLDVATDSLTLKNAIRETNKIEKIYKSRTEVDIKPLSVWQKLKYWVEGGVGCILALAALFIYLKMRKVV